MSAIEKALRQIDGQRGTTEPFTGLSTPIGPAPLDRQERAGLSWVVVLLAVALTALVSWSFARGWSPLSRPLTVPAGVRADAAPPPLAQPVTAGPFAQLPFVAGGEGTASGLLDTRTSRPFWLAEAGQAWVSGLKNEAAALWLVGLRSQAPTMLALRLGEPHSLEQADALYTRWADRLPIVVLRDGPGGAGRWMVLALPAAADLEPAHTELKAVHGAAVQWNSVAHWTAQLTPARGELAQTAAMNREAMPPAQWAAPAKRAPLGTGAPTVSAPLPAPLPAPIAAASLPAASQVPPPLVEAPELRRSAAVSGTDARASTPAVRAIDVDFNLLEQQLGSGQHEMVLDGVQKLERVIGTNWRTRYLAGVALSSLGRWDEALVALSTAQQGNPIHARVPLYLSVAQQELGDHASAIETLSFALEKHPALPELWLNQGHSLQALGRIEEAQLAYWRFLDLSGQRTDLQAQRQWVQSRTTKVN
ncbi:hypothetical protein [Hydrogenophaga sp.]|uniref:hypothetical protein n=1 Tax=Hydrogenophaga sp. TaxID=1904254 RepID=UPI003F6B1EB5